MMKADCEVSLVIPTYNGKGRIDRCLASVSLQDANPDSFEVILVNDGSNDGTDQILDSFALDKPFTAKVIHQENKGVSAARNKGIESAEARLVAFTDDDCILPSDWISKVIHAFNALEDYVAGCGGPLDSFTNAEGKLVGRFIKYLDEFNHVPVMGHFLIRPVHASNLTGQETVPYLRTANAAFRKEALIEVGGFDPDFRSPGGEDPDLSYRLMAAGYTLKFLPDLVVDHQTRASFKAYFTSMRNYVRGDFRKSYKKNLYRNPVISRTYSYLVLQKMVSSLLTLLLYPWNCFRAKKRGFPTSDMLLFPLIVICSKFYALWVAICCQFDLLQSKQND